MQPSVWGAVGERVESREVMSVISGLAAADDC